LTAGRARPGRKVPLLMTRRIPLILSLILIAVAAAAPPLRAASPDPVPDLGAADAAFKGQVAPLLARYCGSCHGAEKPKGDLNLAKYGDTTAILAARKTWGRVLEYVESQEMPPEGKDRPTADEQALIVGWLQARLTSADCSNAGDPGRVTLRRLNRVEYNNTVKDLVGVDVRPADDFPSDDVGYGFDNIGDVLSLPPILFEMYMKAAEKIADAAIVLDEPDRGKLTTWDLARLPASAGGQEYAGGRMLATTGEVAVTYEAKAAGDYFVVARASADQAGPEPAMMEIRVDGKAAGSFPVTQPHGDPGRFEVKVPLSAGSHAIAAAFTNDYYNPDDPSPDRRDRNLVVARLEAQGPADAELKNLPRSHKMILTDRKPGLADADYASAVLEAFASRAYRRPATRDEVDRLMAIYGLARKNGEKLERAVQVGVQAALMSPHFLFKVEFDRTAKDGGGGSVAITDDELASRLSYFLWSSMPDAELLDAARSGKLRDDAVLEAQARRMLKSKKSYALVENFAGQWLQLRNLKTVAPDPKLFPDFDESLRAAMLKETETYFNGIKDGDRSILEFLDSDYTYLNRRMARHYGIKNFKGGKQDVLVKWDLTDGCRGGLLTQASILTVTSNPTRTSPVKRGKWVLEQIFNTPPPPPPPDVPDLKEGKEALTAGTVRQRMEQHRANPNCATCHAKMDPLGFGLENFDAIGSYREKDGGAPIDASGVLPGGKTFDGPKELRKILLDRRGDFTRCLAEKLMTYALGRGLDYYDRCAVDRVADSVARDGHKFSRLAVEIVKSEPFRKRRPKGTNP